MYDSYMKTDTYPLAVPHDLLREIRRTAKATGLSMADAMRQGLRLRNEGLGDLELPATRMARRPSGGCRFTFGASRHQAGRHRGHVCLQ
jgi:hypothetical protein